MYVSLKVMIRQNGNLIKISFVRLQSFKIFTFQPRLEIRTGKLFENLRAEEKLQYEMDVNNAKSIIRRKSLLCPLPASKYV